MKSVKRQTRRGVAPKLRPTQLIAPCGINCALCHAFLRQRNRCPGCRASNPAKPVTRCRCVMKTCPERRGRFCGGCAEFPCPRLAHLDQRYLLKYGASPLSNLRRLAQIGLRKFVLEQSRKWTCPGCGETLCMHKPACLACGKPWH